MTPPFVPAIGDIVQRPDRKSTQTLFYCIRCKALMSHDIHDTCETHRWISCHKCCRVNRVTEKTRKVTRA